MEHRNRSIDFLRFLGALVIMVAHAEPPTWLAQLRNFGTPMLVIVSALSIVVVFEKRPFVATTFLSKRLLRIAVPPWLFLTTLFGLALIAAELLGKPFPFSLNVVEGSYSFTSGIGYVWIFKVYIIVALLTPLMLRFKASVPNRWVYFAIILCVYAGYEFLYAHLDATIHNPSTRSLVNDTLIVGLPYAVLFAYGLQLAEFADEVILWVSLASLLTFCTLAWANFQATGHLVLTQAFKYPPRLYYLSYAIFCINSLYLLSKSTLVAKLPQRPIQWVSMNLMWVYLWHIPGLSVWDRLAGPTQGNLLLVGLKLFFIVAFGVSITYLQKRLVAALLVHLPGRMGVLAHDYLG